MDEATCGSNNILPLASLVLHPWVHDEPLRSGCIISTKEGKLFNEVLTFEAFLGLKNVEMKISEFGVRCHLPILNFSLSRISAEAGGDVLKEEGDSQHELLRWATTEQLRLAEELQKVLGDAVKVRVKCQSQYCNGCMRVYLERTTDSSWKNEKRNSDPNPHALFQVGSDICTDKCETITGSYSNPPIERTFCCTGVSFNRECFNVGDDNNETNECPGGSSVIGNSRCVTRNEPSRDRNCHQCGYICPKVPGEIGKCTSVDRVKLHPLVNAADVAGPDLVKCRHAKVAILFSGGVDSLVIAALADKYSYCKISCLTFALMGLFPV